MHRDLNMERPKQCAECDEMVKEMKRFLSRLFASDEDIARISELLDASDLDAARHRLMVHHKATGHTPVPVSTRN